MAAAGEKRLPQGVLNRADLQLGVQAFLLWDPALKEKSAFELENAREALIFCQPFFKEDRTRSCALACAIMFFTILQMTLDRPGTEPTDCTWTAHLYTRSGQIQPMQEKIEKCPALTSRGLLAGKVGELDSAPHFEGCFACLDDLLVHMKSPAHKPVFKEVLPPLLKFMGGAAVKFVEGATAQSAEGRSHRKQPSESAEQVDSSAEDSVLETGVLVESTKKHRRRREKEALAPYVRLTPMRIRPWPSQLNGRNKAKKKRKSSKDGKKKEIADALVQILMPSKSKKDKKEKKKKPKKKKKKKRKLMDGTIVSCSSSYDSTSEDQEEEKDSSESDMEAPIRRKSRDHPGSVLAILTSHVREQMEQGALTEVPEGGPTVTGGVKVATYFAHVKPSFPHQLRELREMHSLAATIDLLRKGDIARVGDSLAARYMALHQVLLDQNWATARHMELHPMEEAAAGSPALVLASRKHGRLVDKVQGRPSSPWASWQGGGRGRGKGTWKGSSDWTPTGCRVGKSERQAGGEVSIALAKAVSTEGWLNEVSWKGVLEAYVTHGLAEFPDIDGLEKELLGKRVNYSGEEVGTCHKLTFEQIAPALPPAEHGGSIDDIDGLEKELLGKRVNYSGEEVGTCHKLTFEQIAPALPPAEHGGSIDVLKFVSQTTRSFLLNPDVMMVPRSCRGYFTGQELGAFLDGSQRCMGPSAERLVKLIQATLWLIQRPVMAKRLEQVIAGRWVHVFQFRRPSMSLLSTIWEYISSKGLKLNLQGTVRTGLNLDILGQVEKVDRMLGKKRYPSLRIWRWKYSLPPLRMLRIDI
ncbi:unnamed protein product [Cladocopium goreaui]|uniref:Uncharacterized protein n=1 Tax=Cladocopium goreaui TaxID=2562237 RepID=A0A9P1DFQ6_9DINO|nr:unnamed protein product [Cladocopium goreaui]